MILTKLFLILVVVIAMITESYATKYKNDPYKAQIKLLKAARKAEKYRQKALKYAPRPQLRPFEGSYESSESSSEEWSYPFGGPFPSSYPQQNYRPNRPGIVESVASASAGGSNNNGGNNGGGNNGGSSNGGGNGGTTPYPILQPGDSSGNRLPFTPGQDGNGGGGSGAQDPLQQLNQGLNGFLQGIGSLTLGQLFGGGGFRFPTN